MADKNAAFRILILVTTPKLANKAAGIISGEGIPIKYRLSAVGTATNEIMDVLGLGSIDKTILFCMVQKQICRTIMNRLSERLKMRSVNSGIAFTVPLTGMSNLIIRMLTDDKSESNDQNQRKDDVMSDIKYSLIAAVINRGYSSELMDAAKEAGASGGTLINSRRLADEEICSKWGLGTQEEKEIVLIVAEDEKKVDIMKKIGEKCGTHSAANGVVFSLPIEDVTGIGRK